VAASVKIVIVAASDLQTFDVELPSQLVSAILAIVSTLPPDAEVAVRGPGGSENIGKNTKASVVEDWVYRITGATGRRAEIYRPVRAGPGGGRAAVYLRDYDLVDQASHVYAYFRADKVMEGGTGHVVKAALDRNIPVEAWTISDDQLVLIGSDDGLPATAEELAEMYTEVE
jgi:hypothetical protein